MRVFCRFSAQVIGSELEIRYGNNVLKVDLEECYTNYRNRYAYGRKNALKCVGTRNIMEMKYVFFTEPLIECSIKSKCAFRTRTTFQKLQKLLNQHGYTTYDIS